MRVTLIQMFQERPEGQQVPGHPPADPRGELNRTLLVITPLGISHTDISEDHTRKGGAVLQGGEELLGIKDPGIRRPNGKARASGAAKTAENAMMSDTIPMTETTRTASAEADGMMTGSGRDMTQ